jgi:hypothetical protein
MLLFFADKLAMPACGAENEGLLNYPGCSPEWLETPSDQKN